MPSDNRTASERNAKNASQLRRAWTYHTGEPLPTSYGQDSYQRIFGPADGGTPVVGDSQET